MHHPASQNCRTMWMRCTRAGRLRRAFFSQGPGWKFCGTTQGWTLYNWGRVLQTNQRAYIKQAWILLSGAEEFGL